LHVGGLAASLRMHVLFFTDPEVEGSKNLRRH
jgi:hypothetical protein